MDLELPAGFETAKHAHQPAAHAIVGQDIVGEGFFIDLAGVQILHRASGSFSFSQGSCLQSLCDLFDMVSKILEQDLIGPKIAHHPLHLADGAQVSAKYQTVESRECAGDFVLVFGDKLMHGRSPPVLWLSLATYK